MAKGLEFKSVFIVGLEENLFPSQMMLSSRADLEEERRLFYVAITRAEKRLRLGYALSRYKFGSLVQCEPSRFLTEIDPRYLRMTKVAVPEAEPVSTSKFIDQFPKANPVKKIVTTSHVPSPNFVASPVEQMTVGCKVEHAKFGFGIIKALDVSGPEKRATVQFELVGEKVMLLSFAKLMVVN
jgi:DNA helicase-2/ATP-dependent DNA helicase PcrA